jgi:hypothetical protein
VEGIEPHPDRILAKNNSWPSATGNKLPLPPRGVSPEIAIEIEIEIVGGTGNALPVLRSNKRDLDIFSSFGSGAA